MSANPSDTTKGHGRADAFAGGRTYRWTVTVAVHLVVAWASAPLAAEPKAEPSPSEPAERTETSAPASAPSNTSASKNPDDRIVELPQRTLGGHRFLSSRLLSGPFLNPYVSGTLLGGYVGRRLEGPDDATNQQFIVAGQRFEGLVSAFDRIGLRLSLGGALRAAASESTALHDTALGGLAFGTDLKGRLWSNEHLQLGAEVGGEWTNLRRTSPQIALERLADHAERTGQPLPEDDLAEVLFAEGNLTEWHVGLQMAAGLAQPLGAWLDASFAHAETTFDDRDISREEAWFRLGGAVSLNTARTFPSCPFGLLFGYRHAFPLDADPDGPRSPTRQSFTGGLFYTGRGYMDLGLEVRTLRTSGEGAGDTSFQTLDLQGQTRLRVYF